MKVKEKITDITEASVANKKVVLGKFCISKWSLLTDIQKGKHYVFECKGCLKDDDLRSALQLFPISKKDLKGLKREREGGLFRPSQDEILKETTSLVKQLNSDYRKDYGTTFDYQYRKSKGKGTTSVVR